MKNQKLLTSILMIVGVLSLTIGVTVAFFNYTRTGNSNTLAVGRINFNSTQNGTLSFTNVFPIDSTEAATDTVNAKTMSVNVVGDTDYTGGLEYVVTISDAHMSVGNKTLPVTIDVSVTGNGLGTAEEGNYYTSRRSYTTSKYKIEYKGKIENGAHILVGYIAPNETPGLAQGINGTINLKAYIDKDRIAISDTYDGTESDNMGTTNEWVNGRTVFTTSEWNSIAGNSSLSFKIKVEANEGIWVESIEPEQNECFATSVISEEDKTISITNYYGGHNYNLNNNLTTEELNICTTFIENKYGSNGQNIINAENNESAESYCAGTGTIAGITFESSLANVGNLAEYTNNELSYLLDNNIIFDTSNPSCSDKPIIPNSINGYKVISIGDDSFSRKSLLNVTLPNTVTSIGSYAFSNNYIQNLVIPSNVEEVGHGSFGGNLLTNLTIENGLRTIGYAAFTLNPLSSITIPNSVETIGDGAFAWTSISSVTIPSSVVSMSCNAFGDSVVITYENQSFVCTE